MSREFADIHAVIGQVAKDYQYKETLSMPDWLTLLWEQIWQFLGRGFSWFFSRLAQLLSQLGSSLGSMSESGKWLVIIFLAVLLWAAIGLIIWQQKRWQKNNRLDNGNITGGGIAGQPRTSSEWKQQVFLFCKDQDRFDEACRALHRACLQMLDEANLIIFAPARSNYEYAIALARLPASVNLQSRQNLRQTFQTFSNTVDAVYFGNRTAGEPEFQFCLQCLQVIESCLPSAVANNPATNIVAAG